MAMMNHLSLVDSSSSTQPNEYYTLDKWTYVENKLYEDALAMCEDHNSLAFFQYVAFLMPWKSIQAIQYHHQLLLKDIAVIESSNFDSGNATGAGAKPEESKIPTRRQKKKAIPWTLAEHKSFLKGLQELGKGEWKSISNQYVTTRTPSQIASHAQKFEKRKYTTTPVEKRRASINDIQHV